MLSYKGTVISAFFKLKENQIEMSDIERDAPSLVIISLLVILVIGSGFVGFSLGEKNQIEKEKELGKCLQEFKSLDKCVKLTGVKIKSVKDVNYEP